MTTNPPTSAATPPMDSSALAALIADASLLRGTFTLRSGRTSSYYLDKYRFSTRPEILSHVGLMLAERVKQIEHETSGPVARLAGAELGGIPLVTVTGLYTEKPTIFIRNQKKDYGTAKQLEGEIQPGDRVVFLEDVATTAGQSLEAAQSLKDAGAEVVAIITVIDRLEGARENVEGAGYRFEALFTKVDLGVTE